METTSKGDSTADLGDFGDFASTDFEECEVEDDAEAPERYDIGRTSRVFYPICLGEVLNERYLVEHKLGHGGFSTVWMAHDLQDKRDVALKVMSLGEYGEHESRIQSEILRSVPDTSHLATYLATFPLPRKDGPSAYGPGASLVGPISLAYYSKTTAYGHSHVRCPEIARDIGDFTQRRSRTPR
jgi:hypothetical protein